MRWRNLLFAACLLLLAMPAIAQDAGHGSALDEGRLLLKEHNCNGSCHQSYSEDNNPLSLYTRAERKIRNRVELDLQVKRCVASLGAMIFPEDLQSVSAALDHDYYKFK